MVTRKPIPQAGDASARLAPRSCSSSSIPPYPVPPSSTNVPQTLPGGLQSSADPESEIENAWNQERRGDGNQGSGADAYQPPLDEYPDSSQAGHPVLSGSISQELLRPRPSSTNPFLQRQAQKDGAWQESSGAPPWRGFSERRPQLHGAPPRPPMPQRQEESPSEQFAGLSIADPTTNPWQPALDEKPRIQFPPTPMIHGEDSGNEAWSSTAPARQAPIAPTLGIAQQPVLVDIDEPESPAWDEDDDEPSPPAQANPASNPEEAQQVDKDRHVWEENRVHELKQDAIAASQYLILEDKARSGEGWNLVDHKTVGSGTQKPGAVSADHAMQPEKIRESTSVLAPRVQEQPPQLSSAGIAPSSRRAAPAARPEIPAAVIQAQKRETYEIKKISWHDVTAPKNPRVSPILVQNANGPCPLLALVNALTLSTPANVETALVETLRSRERVSLGLLLDAVFDELMSGRRGDAAQELPDVSDLYAFLITLHTGMNVNPLFFPSPSTNPKNDPQEQDEAIPGTFEDTREMKLYSTFSVPLIHGWLPEPGSTECTGLARSARSYEDAQNLMFHEEGLEDKLIHEGLSFEEQATLEDIATIKAFFSSNATQLTPFGLQTVTISLIPGATAILFRNDHFSTLYRHPDTLQLLQLVTDMGYSGHEEVVWESLIDVTGEKAEFFSGDFRLVGGAAATPYSSTHGSSAGWSAGTSHQGQPQNQNTPSVSSSLPGNQPIAPHSPNIEQEDHDLALALQLQEEEEERHRNELARQRRERETELSRHELRGSRNDNVPVHIRGSGGGRGSRNWAGVGRAAGPAVTRPQIQPRRNNLPVTATVPAVDPEAGIDAPPPSYEQAADQEAYIPPADHPSHPTASPNGTAGSTRRASAYSSTSSGIQVQAPLGLGRGRRQTSSGPPIVDHRRSMVSGAAQQQGVPQQQGRDRDCIIM